MSANKIEIIKKYIEKCKQNCEMAKNMFNSNQQIAYMLMGLLNSEKTQHEYIELGGAEQ